jgi:hypothetical protein
MFTVILKMKSPNEFFVTVGSDANARFKPHTNIAMGHSSEHISHYTTVMGPSNYKVTFVVHISLMAALINLH